MTPQVTIGVFCFNQLRFLEDCLRPLRALDPAVVEVVFADDGSNDGSVQALAEAASSMPGSALIADGENVGLSARMQQVVERARGDWLLWIAADDALVDGGVERLLAGADRDVDVVWGNLEVMDVHGRSLGYSRPADTWQGPTARRYSGGGRPLRDIIRVNSFITGGMSLIRRTAVERVGGYPPGLRPEDLNMWLTLGAESCFRYIDVTVGRYRIVPGSGSRHEPTAMANQAAVCRHQLALGAVQRADLARLMAMRWALHVGRTRGRPHVTLSGFADQCGLAPAELRRALPRAGFDPIALSGIAWARRHVARASAPASAR